MMKEGTKVKIRKDYFDDKPDIHIDNSTYTIMYMFSPFGITIRSKTKQLSIKKKYLITVEELKKIERLNKIERIFKKQ